MFNEVEGLVRLQFTRGNNGDNMTIKRKSYADLEWLIGEYLDIILETMQNCNITTDDYNRLFIKKFKRLKDE